MINYVVWNVNPEIFRIENINFHFLWFDIDHIAVRWYGLLFAFAFLCGYFLMTKFLQKEKLPLQLRDILLTYMFIGTVVGARLGHCLFYEPAYYLAHPLDILKIWEGGLASHGAAIGILIVLYVFSRKHNMPYLWILDRAAIIVALSGVFIRTGNLMNSEIIGRATDLPWAFIFVRLGENIPRHPTQIYEALSYFIIFISMLLFYYNKNGKPKEGIIFGSFLIALFTMRFVIEYFKEVQVDFENTLPLDLGQLLSIPFILAGIIILIFASRKQQIN